MNVLVIGYKNEPMSAWSARYLPEILLSCGWVGELRASTFWIETEHTEEGMLSEAIDAFKPDVAIGINLHRYCFGAEASRIKTFITWIQDWCRWMSPAEGRLWSMRSSVFNDWLMGYTELAEGFRDDRKIRCPFLLPKRAKDDIKWQYDIVGVMNRGEGWDAWWREQNVTHYLKSRNVDPVLLRFAMSRLDSRIQAGEVAPAHPDDKGLAAFLPENVLSSLKGLGDDREWFEKVQLSVGLIGSAFRNAAGKRLQRGDATFCIAGFGWDWLGKDQHVPYVSPQHVLDMMRLGRYVLHVSHFTWQHHRTALSFLAGRMPLELSDSNYCGEVGDVDSYMEAQSDFLLDLLAATHEQEAPSPMRLGPEALGTPARITMESLGNFKRWMYET